MAPPQGGCSLRSLEFGVLSFVRCAHWSCQFPVKIVIPHSSFVIQVGLRPRKANASAMCAKDCMWRTASVDFRNQKICARARSAGKYAKYSKSAAAPQDDGEGATRLRKNAISCSVAQLGAMENLAAQVFPQACRRIADTKHVKECQCRILQKSHSLARYVARIHLRAPLGDRASQ